jgi:hypothetical protein
LFVRQETLGVNRKNSKSDALQVAYVTSLDETVESFRSSLSALFSSRTPDQLLMINSHDTLVELPDSSTLRCCNFLCFQVITARFFHPLESENEACASRQSTCIRTNAVASQDSVGGSLTAGAIQSSDEQDARQCAGGFNTLISSAAHHAHTLLHSRHHCNHHRHLIAADRMSRFSSARQLQQLPGKFHCMQPCCSSNQLIK